MLTATSKTLRSIASLGLFGLLCAAPAAAQFDLSWNTINGGGATFSINGALQLGGTIGQPDAGATMTGAGGIQLTGGFWAGVSAGGGEPCIGDLDDDNQVALSDLTILLAQFGCMRACTADLDNDGDVDVSDLALLLANFGEMCPP